MYKIKKHFTFHHYWGAFCEGAFVLGELLSRGLLSCSRFGHKGSQKRRIPNFDLKQKIHPILMCI